MGNSGSSTVTFGRIQKDELPELLELYRHLHSEDCKPKDERNFSDVWKEICSNEMIFYFGAYCERKLVGSCHLVIVPNLSRGCRPYGMIENVVTHADYRSRGIAKGVLQWALQKAWERDCYKVMLMTGSKQEWVLRFYEKAGFKRNEKTAFLAKPKNSAQSRGDF